MSAPQRTCQVVNTCSECLQGPQPGCGMCLCVPNVPPAIVQAIGLLPDPRCHRALGKAQALWSREKKVQRVAWARTFKGDTRARAALLIQRVARGKKGRMQAAAMPLTLRARVARCALRLPDCEVCGISHGGHSPDCPVLATNQPGDFLCWSNCGAGMFCRYRDNCYFKACNEYKASHPLRVRIAV